MGKLQVTDIEKEKPRDINEFFATFSYRSAFQDAFEAFTRNPLWDLKTFRGETVCFKNLVFPLLPRMIFGLYYNTPLVRLFIFFFFSIDDRKNESYDWFLSMNMILDLRLWEQWIVQSFRWTCVAQIAYTSPWKEKPKNKNYSA